MNHLEIEYKTMLTKAEFDHLQSLLSHVTPVTQTNYYFESADSRMRSKKLSLRIRTFEQAAEMTLKIPKNIGTLEHNIPLSREEARHIIDSGCLPDNAISQIIREKDIDTDNLIVLGHLTTIRREVKTNIGLMALDRNQYAGRIDYELELEVEDADYGKLAFEQYLKDHNINFKYAKSKVARFCATLDKK